MISARVSSSAVAVSAMRGTPGNRSCSTESWMYSGRKSWPHCETQCASSMANSATLVALQQLEEARRHQPLGRDVEQVELAGRKIPLGLIRGLRIERGVEHRRVHAGLGERRDLVLHQRDQRRHHHRAALAHQRRNLIAQRLAAAGRHQHQRVAAGCDMLDDLGLRAAKCGVAEDGAQERERGRGERAHGNKDSGGPNSLNFRLARGGGEGWVGRRSSILGDSTRGFSLEKGAGKAELTVRVAKNAVDSRFRRRVGPYRIDPLRPTG